MTWVAVAVVGGSVVAGAIGSSGAQSAADTQANAANNAQQISQQEFNTITAQEQPYMNAGYGAQSQLNYLLGIGTPGAGGGGTSTSGNFGAPGTATVNQGYDPSSGYHIGAGGSISQQIPGGSGGAVATPGGGTTGAPPVSIPGKGFNQTGFGGVNPSLNPYALGLTAPTGGAGGSTGGGQGSLSSVAQGGIPTTATSSTGGGYGSLLSPFTADTFKQYSPAYQFALGQGQQGVLNGDTSSMGALSGAAQKDLIGYNQNMANTSFNNAFNQYQTQQGNIYSRLAGIANLGQSAASNTAQSGTALAGQAAQSATNVGSALAAGQVGSANAWSGAVGNLGSLAASNVWASKAPNVSEGFDGATVGG
jgi:hypothetical protein